MSRTWNWGWNSSHASHRALCCDLYFLVCVTPVSTTQDGMSIRKAQEMGDPGSSFLISRPLVCSTGGEGEPVQSTQDSLGTGLHLPPSFTQLCEFRTLLVGL